MGDQLEKRSNHSYLSEDANNRDSDEKDDKENLSSIGADNEKELVLIDCNTDDHDYNDRQQQQQQQNDDTEDDERVIIRYYVRSISPPPDNESSLVEDDDRQFFSRHANFTISHNSAFIRVSPTDDSHGSDSGESTNSNNSQNQPSSLQQWQELPQAYPISSQQTATGIQVASCAAHTIVTQHASNDNNDNNNPEQSKKRSWKLWVIVLSFKLLAVSITFILLLYVPEPINTSTNVTTISNTTITVANSTEEGIIIKQDTNAPSPSPTPSLQEEKQEELKCFTNPLEIQRIETEMHLNGHDSSIPRTYIVCPNSFIHFFGVPPTALEFDYSVGSYFPFSIFRPNVSILCGSDGDIRNNCTLYGGFCNISLFPRTVLISYPLNDNAENTTISGFQFTGATQGPRICTMMENSITVKNSHFYNNQNQIADILVFPIQRGDASINVNNCTFENNTYTHQQPMLDFELDDIINFYGTGVLSQASFSYGVDDMSVDFQVHNSKFINNTFLKGKFSEGYTSAVINFLPTLNDDNKNHTDSSPNKKKKKSTVGVYNSCFIGNKGYSSSLILGEDTADGRISYDLRDNFFTDNMPMHSGDTNNMILQQEIIIEEEEKEDLQCKVGYQRFILTENRIALEIHELCPTDLTLLDWPEKEMCTV